MCLEKLTTKEPLIAKMDIVCYKHIIELYNGEFITSYRRKIIKLGKIYHSRIDLTYDKRKGDIIQTALHSYVFKKDAKFMSKYWTESLVKCVIPKNSQYYIGEFNKRKCYASDTLKYVEIIK